MKDKIITQKRIDSMLLRAAQGDSDVDVDVDLRSLTAKALSRGQLKTLDLSSLAATALASSALTGFACLRKLDLSGNALTELPDGAFGTRATSQKFAPLLSWVNLSKNQLRWKGLKPLAPLEHLVTLNLSDNKLSKFPKVLSRRLVKLKALVLSRNQLKSFEVVHDMRNLNSLVLSHNRLASLEEDTLRHMPQLAKLSLSHNALKELPPVAACPLLAELRVAHNQLEAVTATFAGLKKLKLVDLGHNRLRDLEDLGRLKDISSLANLNVSGNPVTQRGEGEEDFAVIARKIVANLPNTSLRILNGKPLEKFGISMREKGQSNRFERAQLKRKKNLVSNKLPKPDPSKPRNKPCPCGSRKKYKLCCERKQAEKPQPTKKAPSAKVQPTKSRDGQEVEATTPHPHEDAGHKADLKKNKANILDNTPAAEEVAMHTRELAKPDKKRKKKRKSDKGDTKRKKRVRLVPDKVTKESSVVPSKATKNLPRPSNTEATDAQSKVIGVTQVAPSKAQDEGDDEGFSAALRRANAPTFESW